MWLVKKVLSLYYRDEHPCRTWSDWPDEVLLVVFSKLDMKSLIICMQVNQHWRDVGEYYCQRFSLWEKLIEEVVDNPFLKLKEKSTLDSQDLFQNALQWYNAKHSKVALNLKFSLRSIKNICIHKDNLIILSNYSMKYCDINDKSLKISVRTKCEKYVETYAFSAKVGATVYDHAKKGSATVLMNNKLHKTDCRCPKEDKRGPFYGRAYIIKAHLNTCYVVDTNNLLMAFQADYCKWKHSFLARYYGEPDTIYSINIYKDNIYLLLKKGDVLNVDMECKRFVKVFDFYSPFVNIYSHGLIIYTKPIMFHKCSVLFAVSSTEEMQISPADKNNQVAVACPGMTCAIEHGPVVIVGYEGGKIKIYLTKKLLNGITTPELRIGLFAIKNIRMSDLRVKDLDVYEGSKGHHLFIATTSKVFEFILSVDYKLPIVEKVF